MKVYIGTSGWTYEHWTGIFYPPDLAKTLWLAYYAKHFNSVELNATFYRSIQESTFDKWRRQTPTGFIWSVKANRFITHVKRLKDSAASLERFFSSLGPLQKKLGPVLFQLPPNLGFRQDDFESFCQLLPSNLKFAIEARNGGWFKEEVLSCLKKYRIAWCIADTAGRYPYLETCTADFIYIRLHGSRALYTSDYTEEELTAWSEKIKSWNRDTYIYFDNDFLGYAPRNALRLNALLGEFRAENIPEGDLSLT